MSFIHKTVTMRKFLLFLTILFSTTFLSAQNNTRISGKIIDGNTDESLGFANVGLYEQDNPAPITGTTTNEQGEFVFQGVKPGTYKIKVQFIGYEAFEKSNIQVSSQNPQVSVGSIALSGSVKSLDVIEVTDQRDLVQSDIGSRVFEVSQDLTARGGNATDILRNIPAVQVDQDGNVSLRGSENLTVLVNGKQSGLTGLNRQAILERIPASTIERIEVVTNPSAKYDADGSAGIINIILKKNQENGWNVNTSFNIGSYANYNGSASFNVRQNKFNVFGNFNANRNKRLGDITLERESFVPESTPFIDQFTDSERVRRSYTSGLGLDYFINKRQTLTFEFQYGRSANEGNSLLNSQNLDENRDLIDFFLRASDSERDEDTYNYSLSYDLNFKKGQTLKFFASYSTSQEDEFEIFEEEDFLADGTPTDDPVFIQRNFTDESNDLSIIQVDYSQTFKKNFQLETGAKTIIRNIDTDFLLEDFNNDLGVYENNIGFSNRFKYEEQVHATYAILKGKVGAWTLEGGLRAELALTTSNLINTQETFENDYFNVFPSAVIAYNLDESQKIQASYSRRINRPSVRALNPFPSFSNPLSQRKGNPFLQPEYTDSYEVGYLKDWDKFSLNTAVFYKRTTGVTQFIISELQGDTTIFSPVNLNTSQNYGVEIIGSYRLGRTLFINGDVNFFRLKIDGDNLDDETSNDSYSWTARLTSSISLPKNFRLQLTAFYRGPVANAQGTRRGILFNSIGLSKSLFKNKASINLRLTDVAKTLRFGGTRNTETIATDFEYQGNTRVFLAGFTYNIGNLKNKRRDRRGDDGNRGGDFGDNDF